MIINKLKLFVIATFMLPLATVAVFNVGAVSAVPIADDDIAAIYNTKCKLCHTPTASKHFDPTKPVEEHVAIILNGKIAAKPPNMPAYKDKGITPEQATALAEFMLQLNPPPTP